MLLRSLKVIFFLLLINEAYALENLGTFGKTYRIAEEDLLKKIKEEAQLPYFSKSYLMELLRKRSYVNFHIPNALRDRLRERKIVYTVPADLVIDGKVIAKKGEKINVLKKIYIPVTYIVLKDYQLPAFLDYAKKDDVTFLIVEGNVFELQEKYPMLRIYAGFPRILKALGVEKVPSIVYQSGDRLVIYEKAWTGKDESNNTSSIANH